MKINKLIFLLVLVSLFAVVTLAVMPQPVGAQPLVCGTPGTPPCPPSGGGGGADKPGPKNHPTPDTTIPTSVPKLLAMPTATVAAVLIPAGGAGLNNPNSELPAIQNPGQGSSPFNFPGSLGMIIAVLIIVVCILGGLIIVARKRLIGSTGDLDLLPAVQMGGNESATLTIHDVGDLGGSMETVTVSIHDVGDLSPDVSRNAREAASDLGGLQSPPGPPTKPPSPNIGDKSGGGTL